MAGFLDVKENDMPTIKIMQFNDLGDIHKFKFIKPYTEENIIEFVKQYDEGLLKRTFKSEEPPKVQAHDVITVVGNTFHELVVDNPKDVLLLFTADKDCDPCQKFDENVFKFLVPNLAHNKDLVFAKIDIIENEVIGVKIGTFIPFFKLYNSDNKNEPLTFKGDLKDYAITNWLMEYASNPISRTPKYDL